MKQRAIIETIARPRLQNKEIGVELATTCPKCGNSMEVGFMPEWTHPQLSVSKWYPGAPREAELKLLGVKVGEWLDINAANMRVITTYRCSGCGYLESYAK